VSSAAAHRPLATRGSSATHSASAASAVHASACEHGRVQTPQAQVRPSAPLCPQPRRKCVSLPPSAPRSPPLQERPRTPHESARSHAHAALGSWLLIGGWTFLSDHALSDVDEHAIVSRRRRVSGVVLLDPSPELPERGAHSRERSVRFLLVR